MPASNETPTNPEKQDDKQSNAADTKPQRTIWPGHSPRARRIASARTEAERGNSFIEGPDFKWSLKWQFTTYTGLIWVQVYLWLIKDWSWSQLKWFWTGMIFGSLAILFGLFLFLGALFYKAYSEAAIAFGLLLWLISNYWWMVGELWGYKEINNQKFLPDVFNEYEYAAADIFYDQHTLDAQFISTLATVWLGLTIFILPFFYNDRFGPMIKSASDNQPRFCFRFFFRDFLEFENAHLFFWSLKDCAWAYGATTAWVIGFGMTLFMMLMTIYFIATSKGLWVELFHYISLLFWVLANGFWAFGELFIEVAVDDDLPNRAWDNYQFLPIDKEFIKVFWARNLGGWFFFLAVLTIASGFSYWLCCAKIDEIHGLEQPIEMGSEESYSGKEKKINDAEASAPTELA